MKELTDLTPALTPTAQTALRAIKTLRQYDLPTSAEAERSVLQSLSVEDCTAVILALSAPESKSESLSPSERVSQILDWLVRSAQTELQANVDRIIQLRTTNPDNELSVDPKQVLQELELRYKERTREFVRALVHAGLSNTVIAGLWSVFERSNTNKYDTDNITRNIPRLGKTIMLTSSQVDRFELSDTAAVLAHIEATIDDLEIQDIDSLPKDTYRVKFESKDAVIQYLRNSGVLDVPEIDICLSAVRDGFIVDLTALEVRPVPDAPLSPAALERTAKEIAIAVVKRWKAGSQAILLHFRSREKYFS